MHIDTRESLPRTDAPKPAAKLFDPTEFTIAAGASQYFRSEIVPDKWHVSFYPVAAMDCEIFLSPDAYGLGFRVGEGAKVTLPGITREITVRNNSAGAVSGVVVAVKGYDIDLTLGRV